ncbi:MAG TPA: glycerol-3-phosphate 1-O-acyltransferase PlsY [Acidobacteriota bacterium]|jgi:glycerol-3-phosphate acyltransferase PlsY|nr:glycerol-3-phosphate 1-O-acyltransferase PlsY [Acidobacteriota bacterium]
MNILLLVAAYFLGAIPFGLILVRWTTGRDLRRSGSGNIGATNALRASKLAGVLTLALDAGKGVLAVWLAQHFAAGSWVPSIAAITAIAGHMFPVFLKFHGGKGVATGFGAFVMLAPYPVLVALVLFVVAVAATRYVSLGSILAAALFPLSVALFGYESPVVWICVLGSVLIIFKHRENIGRIFRGEENKFKLKSGGRSVVVDR